MARNKKNKLFVDDVKTAWTWLSVQIAVFVGIAQEMYEQLEIVREYIQPNVFHHAMAALSIVLVIGRITKQTEGK
jgi:hypothetical protein